MTFQSKYQTAAFIITQFFFLPTVMCAATINGQQAIPGVFQLGDTESTFLDAAQMFGFANFESLKITSGEARTDSTRAPALEGDFAAAESGRPTQDPIDDIIAGKVAGHNDSVNVVPETGSDSSHAPISSEADKKSRSDLKSAPPGAGGRRVDKRVLARIMREQFNEFKQRLTRKAKSLSLAGQQADGFKSEAVMDVTATDRPSADAPAEPPSRVLVGEVVPKAARRAGEEPSGVRSGLLRQDAHPIPVTFTSLPGFPSVPRAPGTGAASVATGATDQASAGPSASPAGGRGHAPSVMIDSLFGGGERGSGIRGAGFSRVPGVPGPRRLPGVRGTTTTRTSSSPPDLMSILQTRLIGGVRSVPSGASGGAAAAVTGGGGVLMAGDSMLLQFDPSIVVNFLTLVALTQQQQRYGVAVCHTINGSEYSRTADALSNLTKSIILVADVARGRRRGRGTPRRLEGRPSPLPRRLRMGNSGPSVTAPTRESWTLQSTASVISRFT